MDAEHIATAVEKLMTRSNGPSGRGREFQRGGPGFDRGPDFGPDRRPDGPPGGPGPRRDDHEGMRGGTGPRGPDLQRRLPRSVESYLAAWAQSRNGNPELALQHLDSAAASRSPVEHLLPSVRAISLQQLGRREEAVVALQQADDGLDRLIEAFLSSDANQKPGPWMDLTDGVILHTEATQLVTGQRPQIDPRIRIAQFDARKLLGIE